MAAGIQSVGVTFRRVTIHTTMHLAVYASNRAQGVLLEDCVFYQTGDPEYRQGDGDVGAGIVIGDETRPDDKDDDWRHAENVTIRRCLVVNAGTLFNIRNNLKAGKGQGQYDGYETHPESEGRELHLCQRAANAHRHCDSGESDWARHTRDGDGVRIRP
jgi:hypothetical protein